MYITHTYIYYFCYIFCTHIARIVQLISAYIINKKFSREFKYINLIFDILFLNQSKLDSSTFLRAN